MKKLNFGTDHLCQPTFTMEWFALGAVVFISMNLIRISIEGFVFGELFWVGNMALVFSLIVTKGLLVFINDRVGREN